MYRLGPTVPNLVTPNAAVNLFVTHRSERATRLRPIIAQKVEEIGLRPTSRAVEVSRTAVSNFVTGATPQDDVLDRYEAAIERLGWTEEPDPAYRAGYLAGLRRAEDELRRVIDEEVTPVRRVAPIPEEEDEEEDLGKQA